MSKTPKLYLKNLVLNNFATFKTQIIQFDSSFNAIIGETGTGKSLIVDALQLLFGQRADKKLIRKSADCTTIEATFICSDDKIKEYFDTIDFPIISNEDNSYQITIKRIIYKNGSAKSFLNFQSCNLATLQSFSKRFVDLVGQFDNQKLLSTNYQMALLDNYINTPSLFDNYSKLYRECQQIIQEIETLRQEQQSRAQRIDYLQFQVSEIESLNPSSEDEIELIQKKNSLQNAEIKNQTISQALDLLSEGHPNACNLISSATRIIESAGDFFPEELVQKLHECNALLEDVTFNCSKEFVDNGDDLSTQNDLDEIIDRLDKYQKLKRKFGSSIDEITTQLYNFHDELNELQRIDGKIDSLQKTFEEKNVQAHKLAKEIHSLRVKHASELSSSLTKAVHLLKMDGADLVMKIDKRNELDRHGISSINFMVETNPGEGYYKVQDIASGGELSRILLAVRQILSSNDSVSVFLFDEIDTGIGGETALSIGRALGNVADNSQVIAITHLPQIATFAKKLIVVSKETENERTFSSIKEVSGKHIDNEVRAMTPLN